MKNVKCAECQKLTKNSKFCNNSCAAKYNNKNRIVKCPNQFKTKFVHCTICDTQFIVNIRAAPKNAKCHSCQNANKICKVCGTIKCKNRFCKSGFLLNSDFVNYFGFNKSTIGSPNVFKEIDRIKNIIDDMYSNLSLLEIVEMINYTKNPTTLYANLKKFGIKFRKPSASVKLSLINGRITLMPYSHKFKYGWIKTWEGKDAFYRSSYELEYATYLDAKRIKYDIENLRIEYWDSQQKRYRVAIPDFYLCETNTIVEIKSNYFYDPVNMKDKAKQYIELGYDFKLILDKEETKIEM